jgi:hypothetical protein
LSPQPEEHGHKTSPIADGHEGGGCATVRARAETD